MKNNTRFLGLLFQLFAFHANAQFYQELPEMLEPVTNNAVCAAVSGDTTCLYSFMGLDSTKIWSGIHLKAWRYNTISQQWQALAPVPNPDGGQIAAAASTVKNIIYVIGGYQVAPNGSEVSSNKVHRFDPQSNSWLSDGANLPKAIDDHVQAVWRDSLIFVVTGWSNTGNVPDVQIYNPSTNSWMAGTPVPNTVQYKVFGASGIIKGDTLYYCGGARSGTNFPATTIFRKGYINPNNPAEISWSMENTPTALGYRMAAVQMAGGLAWLGGSDITYNYNGIAYNGSGPVPAKARAKTYYDITGLQELDAPGFFPAIMDLRGAAQISPDYVITAGGIDSENRVSAKVYGFSWATTLPVRESFAKNGVQLNPNPANDFVTIKSEQTLQFQLINQRGETLKTITGSGILHLPLGDLPAGNYLIQANDRGKLLGAEKLIILH